MKKSVPIVLLILSAAVLVFVSNDDALYSRQIMKITKIETVKEETSRNSLELNEKHYTRRISGVMQNGSDKGEEKDILYEETYSSVVTDRFRVGDKVFVDGTELELKRDFYLALIVCVFIDDTEKNVRAAQALGMKGIIYTNQAGDELFEQITKQA